MNKPLSETHPTLQKEFVKGGWIAEGEDWDVNFEDLLIYVQRCTVDSAEHQKVLDNRTGIANNLIRYEAEVERLKKELEEREVSYRENLKENARIYVVEGERRAMNKIKGLEGRWKDGEYYLKIDDIWRVLGSLGEESTRNGSYANGEKK